MKITDNNKESAKELADISRKIDPKGSYTGNPANPFDDLVQDADDL